MTRTMRLRFLGTVLAAIALVLSGAPAMASGAHHHKPKAYTCTGGEIPSGKYARITVSGACSVAADAVIRVVGNVRVKAGASLDAQSAPSKIIVRHNVIGARGSLVGLGCQPPSYTGNSAHECLVEPDGHSTIIIKGSVRAFHADTVLLNGITVKRNVRLKGGGGHIPWSIKNNTIGGNLRVVGQTADWLGVLFNSIGKNATLRHITLEDIHPDAPGVYIVSNTVGRNLKCWDLNPGVSGGFVPGAVNTVGGRATGQCAALV